MKQTKVKTLPLPPSSTEVGLIKVWVQRGEIMVASETERVMENEEHRRPHRRYQRKKSQNK